MRSKHTNARTVDTHEKASISVVPDGTDPFYLKGATGMLARDWCIVATSAKLLLGLTELAGKTRTSHFSKN